MELWIGADGNVESCAHLRYQPVWVSADFQISDLSAADVWLFNEDLGYIIGIAAVLARGPTVPDATVSATAGAVAR